LFVSAARLRQAIKKCARFRIKQVIAILLLQSAIGVVDVGRLV
jgi:hypothetical protein